MHTGHSDPYDDPGYADSQPSSRRYNLYRDFTDLTLATSQLRDTTDSDVTSWIPPERAYREPLETRVAARSERLRDATHNSSGLGALAGGWPGQFPTFGHPTLAGASLDTQQYAHHHFPQQQLFEQRDSTPSVPESVGKEPTPRQPLAARIAAHVQAIEQQRVQQPLMAPLQVPPPPPPPPPAPPPPPSPPPASRAHDSRSSSESSTDSPGRLFEDFISAAVCSNVGGRRKDGRRRDGRRSRRRRGRDATESSTPSLSVAEVTSSDDERRRSRSRPKSYRGARPAKSPNDSRAMEETVQGLAYQNLLRAYGFPPQAHPGQQHMTLLQSEVAERYEAQRLQHEWLLRRLQDEQKERESAQLKAEEAQRSTAALKAAAEAAESRAEQARLERARAEAEAEEARAQGARIAAEAAAAAAAAAAAVPPPPPPAAAPTQPPAAPTQPPASALPAPTEAQPEVAPVSPPQQPVHPLSTPAVTGAAAPREPPSPLTREVRPQAAPREAPVAAPAAPPPQQQPPEQPARRRGGLFGCFGGGKRDAQEGSGAEEQGKAGRAHQKKRRTAGAMDPGDTSSSDESGGGADDEGAGEGRGPLAWYRRRCARRQAGTPEQTEPKPSPWARICGRGAGESDGEVETGVTADTQEARYITRLDDETCYSVVCTLVEALRGDLGRPGDGDAAWCYDFGPISGNYEDVPSRERVDVVRSICEGGRVTVPRLRQTRANALIDVCAHFDGNKGVFPAKFLQGALLKKKAGVSEKEVERHLGPVRYAAYRVLINHLTDSLQDVAPAVRARVLREGYTTRFIRPGTKQRIQTQAALQKFLEARIQSCKKQGGFAVEKDPRPAAPPPPPGATEHRMAPDGSDEGGSTTSGDEAPPARQPAGAELRARSRSPQSGEAVSGAGGGRAAAESDSDDSDYH